LEALQELVRRKLIIMHHAIIAISDMTSRRLAAWLLSLPPEAQDGTMELDEGRNTITVSWNKDKDKA
jgi:hypothetical protein